MGAAMTTYNTDQVQRAAAINKQAGIVQKIRILVEGGKVYEQDLDEDGTPTGALREQIKETA
jgi:hypothetical protein